MLHHGQRAIVVVHMICGIALCSGCSLIATFDTKEQRPRQDAAADSDVFDSDVDDSTDADADFSDADQEESVDADGETSVDADGEASVDADIEEELCGEEEIAAECVGFDCSHCEDENCDYVSAMGEGTLPDLVVVSERVLSATDELCILACSNHNPGYACIEIVCSSESTEEQVVRYPTTECRPDRSSACTSHAFRWSTVVEFPFADRWQCQFVRDAPSSSGCSGLSPSVFGCVTVEVVE